MTSISYSANALAYMHEIRYENNKLCKLKTALQGNGDFRNDESLSFLKNADIIVTNPPFSLFREYFSQLIQYDKKFLIVGSLNAVTYKEVFPFLKEDKLQLGINQIKEFIQPNGKLGLFGNIVWYTNLKCSKNREFLTLKKKYTISDYVHYDNFSAIEVSRIADIPVDYNGIMGVPVSFLTRYNPEQFELVGLTNWKETIDSSVCIKQYQNALQHHPDGSITNGSKVNTAGVIAVSDKPSGIYYTADNAADYLTCVFVRVLIKKRINIERKDKT